MGGDGGELCKVGGRNGWGYLGGVCGGWRICEEKLLEGLRDVVGSLKLGGRWGENGRLGGLSGYG